MENIIKAKSEKEETIKNLLIKIMYVITSLLFTIPSIIYLIQNKTVYNFIYVFSYFFTKKVLPTDYYINTIIYIVIFAVLFLLYFYILKNISKIFKNTKRLFVFIAIVGTLFTIIIPNTSLDVYSYIGNGWVDSHYNENPYYTSVEDVTNANGFDEMLGKVARCWREEPVIYGPAWSLICRMVTSVSFGNITIALYEFKILYLAIFIGCSYLIYKVTKKKFFVALFALNPYVLFEFLTNVHNDIFLIFFILLAIYFIKNKNKLYLSVACIAIATAIKYLSILLLPFILIYGLKNEKIKNKIIKTILYFIEFIGLIVIFYLFYIKDLNVLSGIFIQQNKYGRSIFLGLWYLFNKNEQVLFIIKIVSIAIFTIAYISIVLKLFFAKENSKIKIGRILKTYQVFLLIFTFILVTNFNAWYIIWLLPTIFWQKAKNIRNTLYITVGAIYSYAITFFSGIDDETVGILYLCITVGMVALLNLCRKTYILYKNKKRLQIKEEGK